MFQVLQGSAATLFRSGGKVGKIHIVIRLFINLTGKTALKSIGF